MSNPTIPNPEGIGYIDFQYFWNIIYNLPKFTGSTGITYGGAVTAGHNNEVLYISPTGTLASDPNFLRLSATDIFTVIDGSGAGICFAGANSAGLTHNEIGLGVDGLNNRFTFGNPAQIVLEIGLNAHNDRWRIRGQNTTLQIQDATGSLSWSTANSVLSIEDSTQRFGVNFTGTDYLVIDAAGQVTTLTQTDSGTFASTLVLNATHSNLIFTNIATGAQAELTLGFLGGELIYTDAIGNTSVSALGALECNFIVQDFATSRETRVRVLDQSVIIGNTVNGNGTTLTVDDVNSKYIFSKPLINIGGVNLTFPNANAAGLWANDGAGVISYKQNTGWTAWTGTATKTSKATTTATLGEVAEAVKAIIDAGLLTTLLAA